MSIEQLAPHPEGARYTVRALGSADFAHLRRLEAEIWSGDGAGELCPTTCASALSSTVTGASWPWTATGLWVTC